MRPMIQREYDRLCAKGWEAANALRHARTLFAFNRREAGEHDEPDATHCVRLRMEPDEWADFEDLCGDVYSHKANPDIPVERLESERDEFRDRCNRDGVWGVITEYYDEVSREWEHADSCWGFVGDDWRDSGHDVDAMQAAIDARTASVRKWRNMCKAAP